MSVQVKITARNDKGVDEVQTIDLVLVQSAWLREALDMSFSEASSAHTQWQVAAAALFLCWPNVAAKDGVPQYRHDLHVFGAQVLEYLFSRGAKRHELQAAGAAAMEMVIASVPSAVQMKEARGNSMAPSGASSDATSPSSGSEAGRTGT